MSNDSPIKTYGIIALGEQFKYKASELQTLIHKNTMKDYTKPNQI